MSSGKSKFSKRLLKAKLQLDPGDEDRLRLYDEFFGYQPPEAIDPAWVCPSCEEDLRKNDILEILAVRGVQSWTWNKETESFKDDGTPVIDDLDVLHAGLAYICGYCGGYLTLRQSHAMTPGFKTNLNQVILGELPYS